MKRVQDELNFVSIHPDFSATPFSSGVAQVENRFV
jgi:hypothetical protein